MNNAEDCFAGSQQDFLVCITVHKAVDTGVHRGELYVKVSLDKMSKNTKTQTNSDNPFFNEYFVFEFRCTLAELLRLTVLFELKRYMIYKKNQHLGELLIDLHSVWNQPNHSYYKRWGRLETPAGEHNAKVLAREKYPYLQIDLAIVSQHSVLKTGLVHDDEDLELSTKWPTHHDFDDIESNLLEDVESGALSNIRYFISFYRGVFAKKGNYMIQVSFAGFKYRFHPFKGKTMVQKDTTTPQWNQRITFTWVFPALAQRFLLLVMFQDHVQWKSLAEYEMGFDDISFGNKPAFGPTFLHLYDPLDPMSYVGRVLLELRSEETEESHSTHAVVTEMVTSPSYWTDQAFVVEFLPILGDHIPTSASQYKFAVRLAEYESNELEGPLKTPPGKFRSQLQTKCFRQESPFSSCLFRIYLPDNRIKFEADFFMIDVAEFIRSQLATFKVFQLKYPNQLRNQAKCLRHIIADVLFKIEESVELHRFDYDLGEECTVWDVNRQQYVLDFFARLPGELRALRPRLKSRYAQSLDASIVDIVNDLHRVIAEINSLSSMMHYQDDWPILFINLSAGGKQVGVCQLNAKYFLNLQRREVNQPSNQCWKAKSFLFKSSNCSHTCSNCGCNAGIVLGCMSIVLESERASFMSFIAGEWASPSPATWLPNVAQTYFRFQIFVHQAKVRPGNDKTECNGYVRVFFASHAGETHIVSSVCSPIWDAVFTRNGLSLPGGIDWYLQNPPMIALELYNCHYDTVGNGHITGSVIKALDKADESNSRGDGRQFFDKGALYRLRKLRNVTPPPLKWVSLAKNGIVQAEVLMSVEFKELVGDTHINDDKQLELAVGIPPAIRPNMLKYVLEVIFVGLRHYSKRGMHMAGKRRAKIIMADLVLSSGLSTSRARNSINFLVAYATGVVSLPDQQEYWPAMIATDVLVGTFNKETTLGAALIPPSPNYLQQNRLRRCISGTSGGTSGGTSVVQPADEHQESEDDRASQLPNVWDRLKLTLGLRSVICANRDALRSDECQVMISSDLDRGMNFSWWTKFYNSIYAGPGTEMTKCKHSVTIYASELEQQPQFSHFQDWAIPVPLVHGVKLRKHGPPREDVYATLKLQIKITPCEYERALGGGEGDGVMADAGAEASGVGHEESATKEAGDGNGIGNVLPLMAAALNPRDQNLIKSLTDVVKIVVRVYVVQGLQIRPRDWQSGSDPYVRVTLGSKMISDRPFYVPNQSNPVFGQHFELSTTLPADHVLEVAVLDHDKHRDTLIGYTRIDLEDRWHTKHRATAGIAREYSRSGYNQWRNSMAPSQLLAELCRQHGIPAPYYYGNFIEVDGVLLGDETVIAKTEDIKERLSVTALNNFERLPSFGYKLVPEHVETRALYNDESPGILQGRLQMWLELYEQNMLMPAPIDLTPLPPLDYEVRVVVQKLRNIQFGDRNLFGQLMSDIYVTGWCEDANKFQSTDIHYRSLRGEAAFNWRMKFPIKYSPNEDMMVIRRKNGPLGDEIEIKRPPLVYFQIWDKDFISESEYLGSLTLNLSHLPLPYKSERSCRPFPESRERINLFNRKMVEGWFPLADEESPREARRICGKMELHVEVCTEAEANNAPAGLGHDPPKELPMPKRAKSSFNPLTHPFKSVHYILWPLVRKYVYMTFFLAIVALGLFLYFSNLPSRLMAIPLK